MRQDRRPQSPSPCHPPTQDQPEHQDADGANRALIQVIRSAERHAYIHREGPAMSRLQGVDDVTAHEHFLEDRIDQRDRQHSRDRQLPGDHRIEWIRVASQAPVQQREWIGDQQAHRQQAEPRRQVAQLPLQPQRLRSPSAEPQHWQQDRQNEQFVEHHAPQARVGEDRLDGIARDCRSAGPDRQPQRNRHHEQQFAPSRRRSFTFLHRSSLACLDCRHSTCNALPSDRPARPPVRQPA